MEKNAEGKMAITRVELRPEITWGGERTPSAEQLDEMHHAAHENCFIANSVKTKVTVTNSSQVPTRGAPLSKKPLTPGNAAGPRARDLPRPRVAQRVEVGVEVAPACRGARRRRHHDQADRASSSPRLSMNSSQLPSSVPTARPVAPSVGHAPRRRNAPVVVVGVRWPRRHGERSTQPSWRAVAAADGKAGERAADDQRTAGQQMELAAKKSRQAAGPAAQAAANRQGVTRLRRTFHDSPRNVLSPPNVMSQFLK